MTVAHPPATDRARRAPADAEILARLAAWPAVVASLRARGGVLASSPRPPADELENRLGTELMALFRDTRSEETFEALYGFARPAVLRWIKSLLRKGLGHLDATELLQDTFVNVYRYPTSFRADHAGSFRVWVRTIAGNIVRRAGARGAALSFQELPEGLREPADPHGSPDQVAVVDEQSAHLKRAWLLFLCHYGRAWEQLSARDREALHLVEVEGRTYEEAGRVLQVRRSNMKMIIFRSRKRIAARMRAAMRGGQACDLRLAG